MAARCPCGYCAGRSDTALPGCPCRRCRVALGGDRASFVVDIPYGEQGEDDQSERRRRRTQPRKSGRRATGRRRSVRPGSKMVVVVRNLDEFGDIATEPGIFGSFVTPPVQARKVDKLMFEIAVRAWAHYEGPMAVAVALAASRNITPRDNPTDFDNLPFSVQRQSKAKRQLWWMLESLRILFGVEIDALPVRSL